MRFFRKLFKKAQRGQSAIEYALVVAVIAAGIVVAARAFFIEGKDGQPSATSKIFNKAATQVEDSMGR